MRKSSLTSSGLATRDTEAEIYLKCVLFHTSAEVKALDFSYEQGTLD
jgi:hypothetical protein